MKGTMNLKAQVRRVRRATWNGSAPMKKDALDWESADPELQPDVGQERIQEKGGRGSGGMREQRERDSEMEV